MAKRKKFSESECSTPPRKRPKPNPVDFANSLKIEEFIPRFIDSEKLHHGEKYSISSFKLHYANQLPSDLFDSCFNLIAITSKKDYSASTFGWYPKRKRREMLEKEMRYLIVYSSTGDFQGFLSFMLTHDSTPSVPVLYIYEIHLTKEARGKRLGKHLMAFAEDIAQRAGVEKVMLTCFKSNLAAREFYVSLGYETDVCSPEDRKTRNKVVKVDYVIMSKELRGDETLTEAQRGEDTPNLEAG